VRHDGSASQAALAMNVADGQVRQAGALELGDGLLDDRVPAVVGLDLASGRVRSVTKAW
jgi:hypothetical protein